MCNQVSGVKKSLENIQIKKQGLSTDWYLGYSTGADEAVLPDWL